MNSPHAIDDALPTELLQEAARWHLTGLLLQCPDDDWSDRLASLAEESDDAELSRAVDAALREVSAGAYHSAFGPGGPAAPREVSHRDAVVPGAFLSDLCGFYEAFAYRPPEHETPDHIAAEVGFLGYLRLKEAYARACGEEEQARIVACAAARFVEEHLALLAHRFAESVKKSGVEYLEIIARTLQSRIDPPPEEPGGDGRLPVLDEADSAFSCGADDGCDFET